MSDIGTLLKKHRSQAGLSLKVAASRVGISDGHLSAIEVGLRTPSVATLVSLTELMKIPLGEWVPTWLAQEHRPLTLCNLGAVLLDRGASEWADRVLKRAYSLDRLCSSQRYSVGIAHLRGLVCYREGRYLRACGWFRRAAIGAHHMRDPVQRGKCLYNFGLALAHTHRTSEALERLAEAIQVFRTTHRPSLLSRALLARANTLLLQTRDYREARSLYRKAAHLCRTGPLYFDAVLGDTVASWCLSSADIVYSKLLALQDLATDATRAAQAHHNIGVALRQMARPEEAISELEAALPSQESPARLSATLTELCLCHAILGRRDEASRCWQRAATLAGAKDAQDVAALRLLGAHLNMTSAGLDTPRGFADDYESRVQGCIDLLTADSDPPLRSFSVVRGSAGTTSDR